MSRAAATLEALRAERPRNRFARASLLLFVGFMLVSWIAMEASLDDVLTDRRRANLSRFVGEMRPFPLRDREWDWGVAGAWAGDLMTKGEGLDAALDTLAISILAIVLAGIGGLLSGFLAARTFATPEPYLPDGQAPSRVRRLAWRGVVGATRVVLVFARSLPEYVLAFLLIAIFGGTAWPAVLALALHNLGILGRLDAETIENLETRNLAALRAAGATRRQLAVLGILPAALPRFLMYFFYRWETCVREATVLGMLGFASLGLLITEARARLRYDEFVFFVLLGVVIVVGGDLVSALARRLVRRAS